MPKALLFLALFLQAPPAPKFTVSGTVRLKGPVPKPKREKGLEGHPACAALHAKVPPRENLLVDPSGGLQWAFVYIKKGWEGIHVPPAQGTVLIDQAGCRFVPHVLGVRVGQTLKLRNSDPLLHNTQSLSFESRNFNYGQPPGAVSEAVFQNPEVMVKVVCNVHPWMSARIGVLDHPFFSVTDAAGRFEIPGLPKGTYTLAVWTESLGSQEQPLVVGGPTVATFVLSTPP